MEGHFVVTDDRQTVAGVFSDDESANAHMRSLAQIGHPVWGEMKVEALCPHCAEHVETEDGACLVRDGADIVRGIQETDAHTLQRVLAGLKNL